MNHENTRLYEVALQLVGQCSHLAKGFPAGLGYLGDQLRRAATSVPLNFAEGCRKKSPKERERFFETAACSAREVSAIIDVAHVIDVVNASDRDRAKDRCDHLCAMLYKFH